MSKVFTQKHYIKVAEVIADQGLSGDNMDDRGRSKMQASLAVIEGLTDRFVYMFQRDSAKFDEAKFRRACGYEDE